MTTVYVFAEGQTEAEFVNRILAGHLHELVFASPPLLGGHRTYASMKKLIRPLLATRRRDLLVTTMIDLFKLPNDFPGRDIVDSDPWKRVAAIENAFRSDIGDPRFLPYIQLHEFEALLLTDVRCLVNSYPDRAAELEQLARRTKKPPEAVNSITPPSWRIKKAVPDYAKVAAGFVALRELGLTRIRAACPHFNEWISKLEQLS